MRKVRFPRFSTVLTALVAVTALILSAGGDAADDPAKPKAEAPAGDADSDAPAEEQKDPYALPADDASSQEVTLYMRRLGRMQPPELTQEGFATHFNKIDGVIDELLTRSLDDRTVALACNFKYEVLSLLNRIGDESAGKRSADFVTTISKDERPEIASLGRRFGFMERMQEIPELDDAARQQLVDDVAAYMQEGELSSAQLSLAMQTASILEDVSTEQAVSAYNLFAKYVEASENAELAPIAKMMRGSARRLDLPGNVMEIAGKTFTGEEFNVTQYKGKVVLVDFWATWCGPCIQEIPNVLDSYEKYHGKGFEVVGVNLDENPEALQSFLDENKLPWIQLFEHDEEQRAEGNAIANYYGITGIPTMILLDQDGKVVSLEARGEILTGQLEALLGPPLEKPAGDDTPAVGDKPEVGEKAAPKVPTKQPLFKSSK